MAYSRRARPSRTRRSTSTRRSTYRGRSSTARGRRTSTGRTRGRTAGNRTIRIVIEQPAANAVARPPIGMTQAAAPRKAAF